jgi:hypothetical protein
VAFIFTILFTSLSPENQPLEQEKSVRYPDDHIYSMYEDPWEFMEQIFIKEPKSELKTSKIRLARSICFLISNIPNIFWFKKNVFPEVKTLYSSVKKDGYKALYSELTRNVALKFLLPTIATLFVAKFFDKIAKSFFKQNILFEKFKGVVVTSPNNKYRLPEVYQKMMEYLHECYIKNACEKELRYEAKKIIPKIKYAIYEHFEEKYQHKITKGKKIPSWLKWCIVSVAVAGTVKLLVSAANDGFVLAEKIETMRKRGKDDDGGGGGGGYSGGGYDENYYGDRGGYGEDYWGHDYPHDNRGGGGVGREWNRKIEEEKEKEDGLTKEFDELLKKNEKKLKDDDD